MLTPEQEAEFADLSALNREIAAAMQSPWEPLCIARAFTSDSPRTFSFTMQVWIDLEAIRSPVLQNEAPATQEEFRAALKAFGVEEKADAELSPEEAAVMVEEMLAAVSEAFAMSLPMRAPKAESEEDEQDGFGAWLPLYACLVTQCGLSTKEAFAEDVGRVFALTAGHRRNQGYKPAGTEYALRALEKEDANG